MGRKVEVGRPVVKPADDDITSALRMINSAKRPMIIMGHGAWEAREEIIALAKSLGAPVVTTFKGKGLIPDSHPNAGGVLGRSGTPIASWFMNECDLQIVLGASFSNHTGINPGKPTIQVDFERMQLGKFHPVTLPIWAEIGAFCTAVAPRVSRNPDAPDQIGELAERWRMWREEKLEDYAKKAQAVFIPSRFSRRCRGLRLQTLS